MKENTVVAFQNPSDFGFLGRKMRRLLTPKSYKLELSRNGYLPERFNQTVDRPGERAPTPFLGSRGDGAIVASRRRSCRRYLRRANGAWKTFCRNGCQPDRASATGELRAPTPCARTGS